MAALHGHGSTIEYLLSHDVDFETDMLGLTPLDYSRKGKNLAIISKLEAKFSLLNDQFD